MQQFNKNSRSCWIGGYSFGALISMQLMMRRPEIEGFISISPPANTEDFSFLAPCPSSGLISHGDADEMIPIETSSKLASKLGAQKNIEVKLWEGGNKHTNYVSISDDGEGMNENERSTFVPWLSPSLT